MPVQINLLIEALLCNQSKVGRMVIKHFQEKATAAAKAEKEEEQRLRKIASFIAKEIRTFWSEAVKVKPTDSLDVER